MKSFVFKSNRAFDPAKLEDFLGAIVNIYGPRMLRYKGVLFMKGTERKVIFQGVHQLMGSDLGPAWAADEVRSPPGGDVDAPKCGCGLPAMGATSKTANNLGRQFFACSKPRDQADRCQFFKCAPPACMAARRWCARRCTDIGTRERGGPLGPGFAAIRR